MLMLPGVIIGGLSAYVSLKKLRKKQAPTRLAVKKQAIKKKATDQQTLLIKAPTEALSASKRDFSIASGSLGLVLAGYFFAPPLALFGVSGLAYLTIPTWKRAYHDITHRKRFTRMVLEATVLPVNLIFGHYIAVAGAYWILYFAVQTMEKAKSNTAKNLTDVFMEPSSQPVYVLRDGVEVEMALENIAVGDVLVIGAGETVPVDGVIIQGKATVDQMTVTGQSQVLEKQQNDTVLATTLILNGHIHLKAHKAGTRQAAPQTHQVLNQMTAFSDQAELRSIDTADRISLPYFITGTVTGMIKGPQAGLALMWAPLDDSLYAAGPVSVLNYLNIGLRRGMLIKDGRSLEALRNVTTIVFDKTAALTHEVPKVANIHSCKGSTETDVLRYAAAAQQKQAHPTAMAILQAAKQQDIVLPSVTGNTYKAGCGISVLLGEHTIHVGHYPFMQQCSLALPDTLQALEDKPHKGGYSLIYVALNHEIIGAIEFQDSLRADALATMRTLHHMNYKVCMISGDHEQPTSQLAKQLGINTYFAGVLPQDKAALIEAMQKNGESICYIGDGTHDTNALQQADVSVSLSGPATISADTAQVVLINETLSSLIDLLKLSQQLENTHRKTLLAGALPSAGIIGGVLFFHMGITAAIITYLASLSLSMGYAISPLLIENRRNKKSIKQLKN